MYMFFFLIHLINVFVGSSINLNKNTLSDFLLDMNVKYGNNDNTMDRIRSKGVPGEIGWARIQQDTDDKTCDHADMIRIMQFGICQQYEAFASRFVEYVSNDGGMDAFNISTYVTADCTESPVTVKLKDVWTDKSGWEPRTLTRFLLENTLLLFHLIPRNSAKPETPSRPSL